MHESTGSALLRGRPDDDADERAVTDARRGRPRPPVLPGDGDQGPTGPARSRSGGVATKAAVVALAGLLGAGAGLVVAASAPERHTVSTQLLVRPDATLTGDSPTLSTDAADRFLQSEVVAVESLAEELLGEDSDTEVTVRQVGLTDILAIQATADTPEQAVETANEVTTTYIDTRQAGIAARAEATADTVRDQIAQVTGSLDQQNALGPGAPEVQALSNEYARLISLLNRIQLAVDGDEATRVVRSAEVRDAEATSLGPSVVLLFALVGAGAAAAALVAQQRWSRYRTHHHA